MSSDTTPVAADSPAPDDEHAAAAPDPGEPDAAHHVPDGVDRATVEAVGKLTAALEVVEEARGMLYGFHRMTGRADNDLAEALEALEGAGHGDLAERIRTDLYGRNVLARRWTFQVVEDYDDHYWERWRGWERTVREELVAGRRHVYEAQLKEENRTHGRAGHEARPAPGA
ncbi:hypothetical protein [Cellulomonas marina]|uniref:Uncharacterized protein n=1 Tax=Cellulomonas marina TaxID=988821 RepID=A0A1I0ZBX8_9CELL|nr:hypothetical protein [Cellulomonas marina]GIG30753.1 hypothetical protein Cma02nite_33530 [Cellulomonas marina]SFB23144.1 hypothetical protein SAMN05421867_110117 [Cellulomonas marina]